MVPNGADTTIFFPKPRALEVRRRLRCEESDFIVLYSGGIGGYYKLEKVISALGKINPRLKIKLIMIGTGPNIDKVMTLARNSDLAESVIHICPTSDKSEL